MVDLSAANAFLELTDERILLILNSEGRVQWSNDAWKMFFDEGGTKAAFEHWVLESDRATFRHLLSRAKDLDTQRAMISLLHPLDGVKSYRLHFTQKGDDILLVGQDRTNHEQENESKKMLAELGKIGMWSYSTASKRFKSSEGIYAIYGFSRNKQISYQMILEAYTEKDRAVLKDKIDGLLEGNSPPIQFVGECKCAEGEMKMVQTRAKAIVHEGQVVEVQGFSSDITGLRKQREERKHWLELSHLALKGIKSGVFYHDLKKDTVTYGEEFKKMIGLGETSTELPEVVFRQMIAEDDRKAAYNRHVEELKKDTPYYFNRYRLQHADGGIQHYEVFAWKQFDEDEKPIRMVGNLINVEEKHQAKKEERRLLNNLQAVVNNGFTYTFLLDESARIVHCDQRSVEFVKHEFGIDPLIKETYFYNVIPNNLKQGFDQTFPKALNGQVITKVLPRYLYDGTVAWLSVRYAPVIDGSDDGNRVLITMLDISEQKRGEQTTTFFHRKLAELARLKDLLVSSVDSVEYEPIAKLKSQLELIRKSEFNDRLKLEEALVQAESALEALSNQHFDKRKQQLLNAERSSLNLEYINLEGYVRFSLEKQAHFAKSRRIKLDFTSKIEDGGKVLADLALVQQVIDHLINLSIQNTSAHHIALILDEEGETGISLELQEHPFDAALDTKTYQLRNAVREGDSKERIAALQVVQMAMELLNGEMKHSIEESHVRSVKLIFKKDLNEHRWPKE